MQTQNFLKIEALAQTYPAAPGGKALDSLSGVLGKCVAYQE